MLQNIKRTESSTRFEKTVDGATVDQALYRYHTLLKNEGIIFAQAPASVVVCGPRSPMHSIDITHADIEKKLGVTIDTQKVIALLSSIGFGVETVRADESVRYVINVPCWRATKDIRVPIDIVEEVARLWGYHNIVPSYAKRVMKVTLRTQEYDAIMNLKNVSAYALRAQEVQNYILYDEQFLQKLSLSVPATVAVSNPLSQLAYRLVDSLVPHLLKNIVHNKVGHGVIRLFEVNKVWRKTDTGVVETLHTAGAWYAAREADFYTHKDILSTLFISQQVPVAWRKTTQAPWWAHPYQSAALMIGDMVIGHAGVLHSTYKETLGLTGDLFVYEMDAEALFAHARTHAVTYKPIPKFPSSSFDVSFLIPLSVPVDAVEKAVGAADTRMTSVLLVDFFEKAEWHDVRSLTIRCTVQDHDKTLEKHDIEAIHARVITLLQEQFNAQIR